MGTVWAKGLMGDSAGLPLIQTALWSRAAQHGHGVGERIDGRLCRIITHPNCPVVESSATWAWCGQMEKK